MERDIIFQAAHHLKGAAFDVIQVGTDEFGDTELKICFKVPKEFLDAFDMHQFISNKLDNFLLSLKPAIHKMEIRNE